MMIMIYLARTSQINICKALMQPKLFQSTKHIQKSKHWTQKNILTVSSLIMASKNMDATLNHSFHKTNTPPK